MDGYHLRDTELQQAHDELEVRFAREHGRPFDVVITDLGMPYLDGRQAAKALKQEPPDHPPSSC